MFLNSQSVFLPNGSLAQAAKAAKPAAEARLASLPAGPYMMAFDGVFPESWFQGMARFSGEAMRMMTPPGGEKLSDEEINKLVDVMQKSMTGMQSMAFRVGPLRPGKSIYESTAGVMKVANCTAVRNQLRKNGRRDAVAISRKPTIPPLERMRLSKIDVGGVQQVASRDGHVGHDLAQMPGPECPANDEANDGRGGKGHRLFHARRRHHRRHGLRQGGVHRSPCGSRKRKARRLPRSQKSPRR